jgi:hypothetical protein
MYNRRRIITAISTSVATDVNKNIYNQLDRSVFGLMTFELFRHTNFRMLNPINVAVYQRGLLEESMHEYEYSTTNIPL